VAGGLTPPPRLLVYGPGERHTIGARVDLALSNCSQCEERRTNSPLPAALVKGVLAAEICCGRYWDRTSDLFGVNEASPSPDLRHHLGPGARTIQQRPGPSIVVRCYCHPDSHPRADVLRQVEQHPGGWCGPRHAREGGLACRPGARGRDRPCRAPGRSGRARVAQDWPRLVTRLTATARMTVPNR
jgi:hypothetical protein